MTQTTHTQPDALQEIQQLIDAAAKAPGSRTQEMAAQRVSDRIGLELGSYMAVLAEKFGVDVSMTVSPQRQR